MKQNLLLLSLVALFLCRCSSSDSTDPIALTAAANDRLAEAESPVPSFTTSASIEATSDPTYPPSIAPTITPLSTEAVEVSNCSTRRKPELPCFWKVLLGDSEQGIPGDTFFSIAVEAYEDADFALVIMNFNRDELGYQARLGISSGKEVFYCFRRL